MTLGAIALDVFKPLHPNMMTIHLIQTLRVMALIEGHDKQTLNQAADTLERLRYALGDGEGKLTASQLTRRAYELFQKAAKWDEWHEAQNRVETEMPEGWAFFIQCSPGDWDTYLTNPDGERVHFDRGCDSLASQMDSAIEEARASA